MIAEGMIADAVAALLGALARWAGLFYAWLAGRRGTRIRDLERAVEVKDAQLRDAARPGRSRARLLERMRGGDL